MPDAIQVNHVPERSRFEAVVQGHVAFTAYKLAGQVMTLHHTVVPPEIERRGIA
ncbi:MAG: N-acetyltransferase, partial [Rhizobacter sp.]|nr:N-acetyltransferase [Rhizobacter sp.]